MGERTGIAWCDHTFNPWWGCVKVSEGCRNCYAETWAKRMGFSLWGPTAGRRFFDDKHWDEPRKWNDKAQKGRVKRRVFCGSMCDLFEDLTGLDYHRERVYRLIEETPWLTWLLLTKRVENVEQMLPERWSPIGYWERMGKFGSGVPENVWLGTTTENQAAFEARWPVLEAVGRRWGIRNIWISAEPLLGPVDISDHLIDWVEHEEDNTIYTRAIDWVVVGGESGAGARPMHTDWARELRDQCVVCEVPFFFKQWGEWLHEGQIWKDPMGTIEPGNVLNRAADRELMYGKKSPEERGHQFEDRSIAYRVGKKAAGRMLDGREWNEWPEG